MNKGKVFVVASVAAVLFAGSAFAHHTRAHFDRTQEITVTGNVVEYHLVNPHAWVYLDVPGEGGQVMKWALETNGNVNQLVRVNWSQDSLTPGDTVKVIVNPLKDGSRGGLLVSVELPDGTVLSGE